MELSEKLSPVEEQAVRAAVSSIDELLVRHANARGVSPDYTSALDFVSNSPSGFIPVEGVEGNDLKVHYCFELTPDRGVRLDVDIWRFVAGNSHTIPLEKFEKDLYASLDAINVA